MFARVKTTTTITTRTSSSSFWHAARDATSFVTAYCPTPPLWVCACSSPLVCVCVCVGCNHHSTCCSSSPRGWWFIRAPFNSLATTGFPMANSYNNNNNDIVVRQQRTDFWRRERCHDARARKSRLRTTICSTTPTYIQINLVCDSPSVFIKHAHDGHFLSKHFPRKRDSKRHTNGGCRLRDTKFWANPIGSVSQVNNL